MEGVRTEELSGSNLHKLSKSSYQKEWVKLLSLFTYYYTPVVKNQRVNQTDYFWSFRDIMSIKTHEPGNQISSHS